MKLGGEVKSTFVLPVNIEIFAEDNGLSRTLAKSLVPELAQTILEAISNTKQPDEVSEKVAALIKQRCEDVFSRF